MITLAKKIVSCLNLGQLGTTEDNTRFSQSGQVFI